MMTSRAKLRRLEARLGAGCPRPGVYRVVQVVAVPPGEPEPQPKSPAPCPRCGRCHELQIVEQIVLVGPDGKEAPG
jgi:hypothetical protein